MRLGSLIRAGLIAAGLVAGVTTAATAQTKDPIKVGILHSLSGTMAISETTLKDVMLMLIEEQNKKGGLLGKQARGRGRRSGVELAAVRREGARAAREGQGCRGLRLLDFGQSRKSVLPVFEELNGLLFYPVQYEGEESQRTCSTPAPRRTSRRFRRSTT